MILKINVTAPDRPIYMFGFFLFDLKITEKKLKFKEKDQYLKLYRYT